MAAVPQQASFGEAVYKMTMSHELSAPRVIKVAQGRCVMQPIQEELLSHVQHLHDVARCLKAALACSSSQEELTALQGAVDRLDQQR